MLRLTWHIGRHTAYAKGYVLQIARQDFPQIKLTVFYGNKRMPGEPLPADIATYAAYLDRFLKGHNYYVKVRAAGSRQAL